jgi:hypothetical protein
MMPDDYVYAPFGESGYVSVPVYNWKAARIVEVTKGWELSHTGFTDWVPDTRYVDGGSGGNPIPGILTIAGVVYHNYCEVPANDGYAVFQTRDGQISADELPFEDEKLGHNIEAILRGETNH